MPQRRTSPADIEAKARRRWDSGALLTAYAQGEDFPVVDIPLHGPNPSEIGDDLDRVREWVRALDEGAAARGRIRYELTRRQVGGRVVGRNVLPSRARVDTYDQVWTLLRVREQVAAFDVVLATLAGFPDATRWVVAHPMQALRVADEWPRLLAATDWLRSHAGTGRYLREVSAPGVDTKFIETHRGILADLLEGDADAAQFAPSVGFQAKPAMIRLRFEPGFLGLPPHISEARLRVGELADSTVHVESALVVENEISYLSVPIPRGGVVVFGEGFRVNRVGALPWLRDVPLHYWGDLDTHGFAILNQLRSWLPQTTSLLMDRGTLLAHQDRWGQEPKPTAAALDKLTSDERALYADLVSDRYQPRLRLEQERTDWAWVRDRLPLSPRVDGLGGRGD